MLKQNFQIQEKLEKTEKSDKFELFMLNALTYLDMTIDDMKHFHDLSPYLILDGHRSGSTSDNMSDGYVEGAKFSLRFAAILKKLGAKRATFLIHTLRNYKTEDRMTAIFDAVNDVGKNFIKAAIKHDIRLRYFGKDVKTTYALSDLVNAAEMATNDLEGFELNYLTNYSEQWGYENLDEIESLPEINVVGRFTKGHYSGANIPMKSPKANFIYIQQASIDKNWSDQELILLGLSLLKSYIAIKGVIGGKSYSKGEKEDIYHAREVELYEANYNLSYLLSKKMKPSKRITSFTSYGPVTIRY